MSTNVASVTSHFPDAENGFTTTTAGSVASGATTVTLNSVAGYTNGQPAVFVIDPTDVTKKQTFTGIIDTSGVQVTNVVWTAGTNTTHALGATVVDYATATHIAMISKGIKVQHNQDGTHSAITATSISATSGTFTNLTINGTSGADGWSPLGQTIGTITANGNRSYNVVISGADSTGTTSPGQRVKFTRTVTAPTQCTSLNGTTQYYSKSSPSGMTFTDDFVVSAWVKVSSYGACSIVSRSDGSTGWDLGLTASGQPVLTGFKGAALANQSYVLAYQSVPLNKWVHVAAQLDMSTFTATTTTSYIMIDGTDVPASVARAGTNPTDLTQAGSLNIGGRNGTANFPGKIAQVAIYNAKVTQTNIRATISQTLAGNETSLISAYSFNNSINDLSATANNLTAQGSAVATNADTPFTNAVTGTSVTAGTTNYGIIMSQTFSTNTTYVIQVPEGETLPTSGGVSAPYYSTQQAPYGFPSQKGKWTVGSLLLTDLSQSSPSAATWYNPGFSLSVPVGEWNLGYQGTFNVVNATNSPTVSVTLSTANNSESNKEYTVRSVTTTASANSFDVPASRYRGISAAATTPYYLNIYTVLASATSIAIKGSVAAALIEAENGYL